MLSYPVAEAEELLKGKLSAAKESLENCEEDLDFLRQQITVSIPWQKKWKFIKIQVLCWSIF